MKKPIFAIALAAAMGLSAFALSGCNGDNGEELIHSARVEATCTKEGHAEYWTDGVKYYTDADGANEVSYDSLKIEKLDHTPAAAWSSNSSGHYHACTVCKNAADEADDHTLGDWVYVIPPSASVAGQGYKVCSVCNYQTPNSTVPPVGAEVKLTEIPARVASCIAAGNIKYWTDGEKYYSDAEGKTQISAQDVITPKLDHAPAASWSSDDTDHWHACTNTDLSNHDAGDKAKHTFEWKIDTPVTESTAGKKHEQCTVCHKIRNENTEIPATGGQVTPTPELTYVSAENADCGNDGHTAYYTDGDKYYSDAAGEHELDWDDDILIPATGLHQEETEWQTGNGKHWHNCSVCGNKVGSTEDVHTYNWVTDVEPTETTQGKKHEQCECGQTRNENTSIPATGEIIHHEFTQATCGADGNIEYWERGGINYSDAACTQPITGEVVIPATGAHEAEAAWQTGDGKHWHNCSVCGNTIQSSMGNHADSEVWVSTDSTQHWKKCTVCDSELSQRENHNHIAKTTKPATCEEAGLITYTCECTNSYTEVDPQKQHSYTKSAFELSDDTAAAPLGGTFRRVCEYCGEDGGFAIAGEWGSQAYNDRKIKIDNVEYTAYEIYTNPAINTKGVTFDALYPNGLFVIDATKIGEDAVIEVLNNTDVSIIVKDGESATVGSIICCERSTIVSGGGTLTVKGNIGNNGANNGILTINGATVNIGGTTKLVSLNVIDGTLSANGTVSVINFTVGDSENEHQPTVNITVEGVTGLTNKVDWHGEAAQYNILSGTVTITGSGSNNGIEFGERSGSTITVGENATLAVNNFATGINGPTDSIINVEGMLKVLAVGPYGWSEWGETHNYAITGFAITVNGALQFQSSCWGIGNSSIAFASGSSSVIIRTNTGNAVFHNMTGITVQQGATLGIKGFDRVIYGNDPSTLEIADNTITVENISQIGNDTLISESMYTSGTVTPAEVVIE